MTSRVKPCRRCGGPKDRGVRGARYCATCLAELGPIWKQRAQDRSLEKGRRQRREAGIPARAKKTREDGKIWCRRCVEYLPPGRFRISVKTGRPPAYCRRCSKAYNHEQRLKTVFGITAEQYDEMLDVQGGRCAICRARPVRYNLAVDHDHVTGRIRGLLCKRCNHELLGAARESVEVLARAICYLESPPAIAGLGEVAFEDFERDAAIIRKIGDQWLAFLEIDRWAELLVTAGVKGNVSILAMEPMPDWLATLIRSVADPNPEA